MSMQMSVIAHLEGLRTRLLSLLEAEVVDAVLGACAQVAADQPEICARLQPVGVLIETATKLTIKHKLRGGGHLLQRRVQLGNSSLLLPFELPAHSTLGQRHELNTKTRNTPRRGQLTMSVPVFTLHRSNDDNTMAVISVAANAHRTNEIPLMRNIKRFGWSVAAQLPSGTGRDKTVHIFLATDATDPVQLQIIRPVPVCTHYQTDAHAKVPGRNGAACCLINAYQIHEMFSTNNRDGTWTEFKPDRFTQKILVKANAMGRPLACDSAAAAAPSFDHHDGDAAGALPVSVSAFIEGSGAERSGDDAEDGDSNVEPEEDDGHLAGSSLKKRVRSSKESSTAASSDSDACSKRHRHGGCDQTQHAPQSAATSPSLPSPFVAKLAPISLPAEQPHTPSAALAAAALYLLSAQETRPTREHADHRHLLLQLYHKYSRIQ